VLFHLNNHHGTKAGFQKHENMINISMEAGRMKARQILALLLVVALMPFAFAGEMATTTSATASGDMAVNADTQNEIQAIAYGAHGAKIRLLELKKSITRNILVGNQVVSEIEASGSLTANQSTTLESMKAALAEIAALKIQVQGVNPENQSAEVAQQFVQFKEDAITLSKEFRDNARLLLTADERANIQAWVKTNARDNNSELADINAQIRTEANSYNSERIGKLFSVAGITNTALVDEVQSGQISVKDARKQLQEMLKSSQQQRKEELKAQLQDEKVKLQVYRQNIQDQIQQTRDISTEMRQQARIQLVQDPQLRKVLKNQFEMQKENQHRFREQLNEMNQQEQEVRAQMHEQNQQRIREYKDAEDFDDSSSDDDSAEMPVSASAGNSGASANVGASASGRGDSE